MKIRLTPPPTLTVHLSCSACGGTLKVEVPVTIVGTDASVEVDTALLDEWSMSHRQPFARLSR